MQFLFLLISTACFLVAVSTAGEITLPDDKIPDLTPPAPRDPFPPMRGMLHELCDLNPHDDAKLAGSSMFYCVADCIDRYALKTGESLWFDPETYMKRLREASVCEQCTTACSELLK